MAIRDRRIRVGIVGCGDVAHRRYLPALAGMRDRVEVGGCCDQEASQAARAADAVRSWSPNAAPHTDLAQMLGDGRIDAIVNLTPAPVHAAVSRIALKAGVHVYSEKPIAASVAEANELIGLASASGLHLLCAPAVAVSRRFRWLAEVVASGRFGALSLAVAHHADPGPAAWREYTGDPSVFYRTGVGPVFDHGIYRLHEMTMLMGPVRRVQAMGAIGQATRVVRGGPLSGRTIEVTTPDNVLINLEFARGGSASCWPALARRRPWRHGSSCTSRGPRSASRRTRSTTRTRRPASTSTTAVHSGSRAGFTRSPLHPLERPSTSSKVAPVISSRSCVATNNRSSPPSTRATCWT